MKQNAYKEAGVDVDAAAALVEKIKPHTKKTARPGVMSDIGGFGALFDLKETGYENPILVSATDGVGTKIKIATELDRHDTIGIDAVAMCVNDLVVQGAEPLFFLDYFATGKLDNTVAETVIAGIAEGCRMAGCALIGGETAEMPDFYLPGDYDLAGFCVGAVERDKIITGEHIKAGDIILGLTSNGVHSNGFSLMRKLVKSTQGYTFESMCPFEPALSLGEMLLMPTRIYVRSILEALKIKEDENPAIKGMAHITGGGLIENLPRALPEGLCAHIEPDKWQPPAIFRWLREAGNLSNEEMVGTLNCGIGFALICSPHKVGTLKQLLSENGESVFEIGTVINESDNPGPYKQIRFQDLETAWQEKS